MYFLDNEDNRIITASLECLQVLFKLMPFKFNQFLTTIGSMQNSFLNKKILLNSQNLSTQPPQQSSLLNTTNDSLLLVSTMNLTSLDLNNDASIQQPQSDDQQTHSTQIHLTDENSKYPIKTNQTIGTSIYDPDQIQIIYFVRYLSIKYLLNIINQDSSNENSKLKSDKEVKVLVKAIALDCCSNAISLNPNILFKPIIEGNNANNLFIYDIIDYINHQDDKMRTTSCQLIGQFINTILTNNYGNYDTWLNKMISINSISSASNQINKLQIESLVDHLIRFIKLDNQSVTNNMCKRFALSALHSFLPNLVKTKYSSLGLEILINILHLRHSTYNLVKCELVDLISSIDFKVINYVENLQLNNMIELDDADENSQIDMKKKSSSIKINSSSKFMSRNIQEKIIDDVFLYLLGSDDSKLRLETAKSLTRFVMNMNFYNACSTNTQRSLLSHGEFMLKSDGYGANLLNLNIIENDLSCFNSINNNQIYSSTSNATSSSSSTAANLLHGNRKRQLRYLCSPLGSVSLQSTLPWLSKSNNILNNNFIQPFHSFIKYWSSNSSYTNTINSNLNKVVEHNLNYIVPILQNKLITSIDKYQFIGCLESLDFIFSTYTPAIYYSSPISSNLSNQSTYLLSNLNDLNNNSNRQIYDLLNLLISYLQHPNVSFDLYVHDIVIRLIGTLFCSYSWLSMKKLDKLVQQLNFNLTNLNNEASNSNINSKNISSISNLVQSLIDLLNSSIKTEKYPQSYAEMATGLSYSYQFSFNNQLIKTSIDQLFVHVMKMLCVLACVVEEQALPSVLTANLNAGSTAVPPPPPPPPPPPAQNLPQTQTSTQPSLIQNISTPSTAASSRSNSPNRNTKLINEGSRNSSSSKSLLNTSTISMSKESATSASDPSLPSESNISASTLPKTSTNIYMGFFQNSSHYLKLYETIKLAYSSYKKSANLGVYDRFLQILKSTLKLFAQLLESAMSVHEIGPHLDEILLYLRILFQIEPSCSVKCVSLCLKSLFSLNLAGLMFDYIQQQLNSSTNFNNLIQNQLLNSQSQNNQQQNQQTPISGLSSVMSTSMTSIASYNQIQPNLNQFTTFSQSTRRNQTSLYHSILTNQINQFTKLIDTQTLMFKNDNLNFTGLQFHNTTTSNIVFNLVSGSNSNLNENNNETNKTTSQPIQSNQNSHQSNQSSVKNTSLVSSPFNLFNLIRKPKQDVSLQEKLQKEQQQKMQQQKELQQQKLKQQQKTDLKTIGQYIKSFESIVIKSLRQYTLTTSVNLQARILELLIQLIFLKVDYSLLDSDRVFIDYVLKQFEYLEQKQDGAQNNENGSNLLSKSYLLDLYENFDSESTMSDPLNPFDLDTMLNKLYSSYNNNFSSTLGAGHSTSTRFGSMSSSGLNNIGSSSLLSSSTSSSPLTSNLNLKQQEHQRNHILIPKLFDFLILLSHEKKINPPPTTSPQQQSNSPNKTSTNNGLLSVPEIMKLCDNLIASENSPHTHAIPALRPLVIDLFLNRTNEDSKELDLQHDVIMVTILRLIQYPQIWPLLSIAVSKHKRDNQDKWKKVSRQVCDALFDSIRSSIQNNAFNSKLLFHEFNGNELRSVRRYSRSYVPYTESLKQLILLLNCLAPQVFRPIDFIILSLFDISKSFLLLKNFTNLQLNNWLCLIIIHLHLLLTHSSEEQILTRLHHLMPQIISNYHDLIKMFNLYIPNVATSNSEESTSTEISDNEEIEEENDKNIDDEDSNVNDDGLGEYFKEDPKFDLNESSLFFGKFLLRLIECSFQYIDKNIKFNSSLFYSNNLTASSSSSLLKDYQTNSYRDLNYTQHLINNQLLMLIYLTNSSAYPKLSNSIGLLINNETKKIKNNKKQNLLLKQIDLFNFNSNKYTFKMNEIILFKLSKSNPFTSAMWQYFLSICNYQDPEYWQLASESGSFKLIDNLEDCIINSANSSNNNSLNPKEHNLTSNKNNNQYILQGVHLSNLTLNEELFKYLSIAIYCDYISTRNQLDNTTGLSMILINNLVDIFELASHETNIWDLFSTIHRNPSASSFFIQSINSNWKKLVSKNKLYLLHSCLKVLEGVHLSASNHLINLLIDKFFNLPYLSLVRYADHIACQRVEMMQSLSPDELSNQLNNEQHTKYLNKFFNEQYKYSFRHQRLISLLEQLKHLISSYNNSNSEEDETSKSIIQSESDDSAIKPSPSIDFFMLYISSGTSNNQNNNLFNDLDKEWFYNMVRSACCYSTESYGRKLSNSSSSNDMITPNDLILDSSSLKSKQCALMLSNLDYTNLMSIFQANQFKLNILKDCILLGAQRSQTDIEKLPLALKKASNLQNDFLHPLWLATTQNMFKLLNQFCSKIPIINPSSSIYESKLCDLIEEYDFYKFVSPLTESINSYLKCIRQYPCLQTQLNLDEAQNLEKINDLISYILFQITYITKLQPNNLITVKSLTESFLCIFNLLTDHSLLFTLTQRSNYSTLVSNLIKDFYQLLVNYFYQQYEHLIYTPQLSSKYNIDYTNSQNITNDVLFNTQTFDLLLKLRFIITNYKCSSHNNVNSESGKEDSSSNSSSLSSSFTASSYTHRYLQPQVHIFRQKIPFNMRDLIEKIYLSICRLPILERFIRIPDILWRTPGFKLEYNQFLKNDTSTLPSLEYLRDPVILKEHLRHILAVGWTSRTQFEYEYVNMLTLLHNLSEDYYLPMSTTSSTSAAQNSTINSTLNSLNSSFFGEDEYTSMKSMNIEPSTFQTQQKLTTNLPPEEIKERNKCICLVIKGLSSWLIKSTLTPRSGNSLNSLYEQVSRNKMLGFLDTQLGKNYLNLKRTIESFNRNNLFTNLNSISIASNSNLLYMLDPTLIDDITRKNNNSDLQKTTDSLSNLYEISMSLSQCDYNLLFSTNIERTMVANLSYNSETYYYYTQISLEGMLKFMGQWNSSTNLLRHHQQQQSSQINMTSIANSITNLVNEDVSTKTVNALNSLIKVAEYLTEDTDINLSRLTTQNNSNIRLDDLPHLVQRSFNRNNLDIASVLRTVLDYYESFYNNPCLQLRLDILKSMSYLGNCLFDSKTQYESLLSKLQTSIDWLNAFIENTDQSAMMPTVNELIDESILSTAIYAECLCKCCLQTSKNDYQFIQMSGKDFERLNRLFENGFKSNSLSVKISTLHGLFYWLESIALGYMNTNNNNDSKTLLDHLCKQVYQIKDNLNLYLTSNTRYISTLWSAVFYAIENCLDSIRDAHIFVGIFVKQTYMILNDPSTPYYLFYQLYMGLERFLLSNMLPSYEINTIQKLFTSKFYDEQRTLCLISLTMTSLYASNQSKQMNYWNDIIDKQKMTNSVSMQQIDERRSSTTEITIQQSTKHTIDYPQILELSNFPDMQTHLLKVLEVATNFLDKMKSSNTAKEASVYASILPKLLCDFLPPHDLLNKLITEFLNSSQHPYPEAIAFILFKCFDLLQEKGLQSQILEWCLLSLSNFLQRSSIYESIWLTSCLLVSSSHNKWLKSTFPFLLNRYCSFETIDRAIFYMSVIEFRKQFQDRSQIQQIFSIFESVSRSGTPYEQLINLLNSHDNNNKNVTLDKE